METNKIYQGDCKEVLKQLPDESVDMVITSPPYWALRDYGIDKQFGLQPTFDKYIEELVDIFNEVKRVLKNKGTCWVNVGDTYYGGGTGQDKSMSNGKYVKEHFKGIANALNARDKTFDYKSKCLCMLPERFAIKMIENGWILRNQIIWYKPNAMPHPVKDRFTVDFEKLFFFTKSNKYYFETQREPVKEDSIKRACRGRKHKSQSSCGNWQQDYTGYNDMEERYINGELRGVHKDGRNKRTVWEITLKQGKYNHCAPYPIELVETPINAGCPENGVVLDLFFGSGTTGEVALKLNRRFIGIELNPDYVKIANERLKPYLTQNKLNDYGGKSHSTETHNKGYEVNQK